ncbi:THO complex subunit 5 [Gracilaria domingensis]|nr:THO complex subunit 5 [Gracilaria domingensis]
MDLLLEGSKHAINTLRDSILNASTDERLRLVSSSTENGCPKPLEPSESHLRQVSLKLVSQFVSLKSSHDLLVRKVDDARKESRKEQDKLLSARSRLDNLKYEMKMLQDEIDSCETASSSHMKKLDFEIPDVTTVEDDGAAKHQHTMDTLSNELLKRKAAQKRVEEILDVVKMKRKELDETKSALRGLPSLLGSLDNDLKPLRSLIHSKPLTYTSSPTIPEAQQLPAPLYVLARQAMGYRDTFGELSVSILGEAPKRPLRKDPYAVHPMRVQIDVHCDGIEQALRVKFSYHINLNVVSVSSVIVADGTETPSYPTKELQMLYPFDFGEESPNPSNAYLERGTFKFDVSKAHGSRPFVWANVVCGITSMLPVESHRARGADESQFAKWPSRAMEISGHVRFKDVCETLRSRLKSIVSLKKQIELLLSKRLPVLPAEIGIRTEPKSRLEDFVKLPPQDWAGDERLAREGTGGKYTEVWCMVISCEALRINCMIGIEPDYPIGPPVFRLVCDKGSELVCEKDVLDLERCVNELSESENLKGHEELLLGAQIIALLSYLDSLYNISFGVEEDGMDTLSKVINGRTRSKRASMMSRSPVK